MLAAQLLESKLVESACIASPDGTSLLAMPIARLSNVIWFAGSLLAYRQDPLLFDGQHCMIRPSPLIF